MGGKLKPFFGGAFFEGPRVKPTIGRFVRGLPPFLGGGFGVREPLGGGKGPFGLYKLFFAGLGIRKAHSELGLEGITTPFTFIATASSLCGGGVQPVFADIDPETWCLCPKKIESGITPNTRGIVPVHVFGNACNVEEIEEIARRHKLKVIYDASHAFGVEYKGESLLKHGDAATLSFHATKLFHTGEGGAIIFKHKEDLERARKLINFGITGPETIEELGINAKMNELQAAMGLCVLDEMQKIATDRAEIAEMYDLYLGGKLQKQKICKNTTYNHAYIHSRP